MNVELLRKHIRDYLQFLSDQPKVVAEELGERAARKKYYRSWSPERLRKMTPDEFGEILAKLWAMRIWGNKAYVAEKLISDNGLPELREALERLLWSTDSIATRWDWFRSNISGMGPAMMSELLCHVHPNDCMLWNRRAYISLRYLGVESLPRYDYQLTGERYVKLSKEAKVIGKELSAAGITDTDLLAVDYFVWRELQVEDNLTNLHKHGEDDQKLKKVPTDPKSTGFLHNDVRDKLAEIGTWLGFKASTEVVVAAGSKVDTVWEATIGNLGRVIYVFEVQTKGSIDSLIINLLKSLKNPAVQCVVAVSDKAQIEKIKAHLRDVSGLHGKLKFWDYEEVLGVREALASVNEAINRLGLVPESF